MVQNRIKNYLDELYTKIQDDTNIVSLCSLYSYVIQIKSEHMELKDYNETLYVDVKCFIENYVANLSQQGKDYGYDAVDVGKIIQHINICPNTNLRNRLLYHASSILKTYSYEKESEYFKNVSSRVKAIYLIRTGNLLQKLQGLISLIINNVGYCLLIAFTIFIVHYIILLPCSSIDYAFFEIGYSFYADNFYLNHLLNLLAYLFGVNETLFCKPLNGTGLLLCAVLQIFYVLFVGGVLLDTIKKHLL